RVDTVEDAQAAILEPEPEPESQLRAEIPAQNVPTAEAVAATSETPSAPPAPSPPGELRTLEIRVPDIGDAQGIVVIEVAVTAGQTVTTDDLLVVVESDKASMEIPAGHDGIVLEVHVNDGSEVTEGTLLVTLQASEVAVENQQPAANVVEAPSAANRAPVVEDQPPFAESPASSQDRRDSEDGAGSRVYAGPAVRRLARELGVELTAVTGSGNRGRIVKDDVKLFVKGRMAGGSATAGVIPSVPEIDFSKFGMVQSQPLSRIRALGASNLHRSWLNIPHVTQHDEVDLTELETFRGTLKPEAKRRGVSITPLAFIIKACCYALKEFPTFNASLDGDAKNFILKNYYHIGFAVDTDQGLVVPVIKDADRMGIWELSEQIAELAGKARAQKLGIGDMQGGSFSVSSLGAIGGTAFTPIINAPEVAILGISRLTTRPMWDGEKFIPRQLLPLSLSYDHRAINGAEAGRFVTYLSELLADIRRLSL
ncbi:MAG: 2-oxo acid dehydrogenase subunit E2, partial [Gammaproteobacteria bacterium]|nr:2-oxo acid dehydrogenase subunit E2 [Gammaproteobacteria bacterium]